jgi:hypothetical protein
MKEPAPALDTDRLRALGLGALAMLLYLATAPAVVNPDGLGYLKLIPHNFAAGHLLYLPILRTATRLFGGDGLHAGRIVNAMLGGSGVVLMYGLTRRALSQLPLGRPFTDADVRFASTLAAAGLGVSYGYWVQGSDVEAYAAAIVALLSTVRLCVAYQARPSLSRAIGVGLLLGVSVLCHLTHVLMTPFVAAWLYTHAPSRATARLHAALAVALGGAVSLGAYAYAALVVRGHDLAGALRWIGTASHGFHPTGGPYRLADAIYGLSKSMIWSPYLYESDAPRLLGQFLLGLLPLVALTALAILRRRALPPLEWKLFALLAAPYVVLGVLFFGGDTERWLFVLPVLWLLAAVVVALDHRRARLFAVILSYFVVLNLCTGLLPARADASGVRSRATEAAGLFHAGDLIVFPGHSWDEYVSFYASAELEPFPLSYYAARDGVSAGWQRLERDAEKTWARGGHIYALRFFDEHDADPRGIDELYTLGLDRAALRAELRKRFTPVTVAALEAGGEVVRLDRNPSP